MANNIEIDFKSATPSDIHRRVWKEGCCILRDAIPEAILLRYRDMVEEAYSVIIRRMAAGEAISDFDRVNIQSNQFAAQFGEENSFFHLLADEKFRAVLESIFGPSRYSRVITETCTRSIHIARLNRDKTSFFPLSTHFDGIYHQTWQHFSINFWVPFSACGAGTNAPGLIIYPANFEDTRQWLSIRSAEDFEKLIVSPANPEPMQALYPSLVNFYKAKAIQPIIPHFKLGDVALFNSWTLHGTFWNENMLDCRRNVEIRFEGDGWNPLPPPLSDGKPATGFPA